MAIGAFLSTPRKLLIKSSSHPALRKKDLGTVDVFPVSVSAASMVKSMEQQGVIRPSTSPWGSPVVLVPTKDGTKRFCVDYHHLNAVAKKDVYPLPQIDYILYTLRGNKYFTSLDLASGYWQVSMDEEPAPKSAFVTHCGL